MVVYILAEFGNDSGLESGLGIGKSPGLGADPSWKSEDPGRGGDSRKVFLCQLGSGSGSVFSLTVICFSKDICTDNMITNTLSIAQGQLFASFASML